MDYNKKKGEKEKTTNGYRNGREERRIRDADEQVEALREKISAKIDNSLKQGIYLPFCQLARIFQLTRFETDILLVCLAPELC